MSDVEEPRQTRTLLLVGLSLVVAAAIMLPACTSGGDDGGEDPEVVVIDESPAPAATPTEDFELAEPGEVEGDPPAETFEVFNARDPFQQLVDAGAGGTTGGTDGAPIAPPDASGTGTTPSPGTGTTTPTDPGATPGTTTPPPDTSGDGSDGTDGTGSDGSDGSNGTDGTDGTDGSDGSDGNGSDANVGGTQVTLVDVFNDDDGERKATVTVNGTGYTVGEGDTFGRRFRLLDISGRCATMLFGDSRFTLCEGERIRK